MQWVGNLSTIQQQLEPHGWRKLQGQNNIERINRLFAKQPQNYLPVFSFLHQGKPPVLVMTKKNKQGKLLVLRLWQSNITLSGTTSPLWLGNVTLQRKPLRHFWLWKKKRYTTIATPALNYLKLPPLQAQNNVRHIHLDRHHAVASISPCEWQGGILLLRSPS